MLYKIKIQLKETISDLDKLMSTNTEMSQKLSEDKGDNVLIYLTQLNKKELIALSVCTVDFDFQYDFEEVLKQFLEKCDLAYDSYEISKQSLKDFSRSLRMLQQANGKSKSTKVLADSDEIAIWLPNFQRGTFDLKDEIITDKTSIPKAMTLRSSFTQELKLIETKSESSIIGHPVHYIIEARNLGDGKDLSRCLVYHLHKNHRLVQNHLVEINLTNRRSRFIDDFNADTFNLLDVAKKLAQGGAVLIPLSEESFERMGQSEFDEILDQMAQDILMTRHHTLYIFCVTDIEGKAFTRLKEKMTSVSFVNLKESALSYEEALNQMRKNLSESHLDPTLASELLEEGKQLYTPSEINQSFALWIDEYLRTKAFPQYAHIKPFELAVIEEVQGKAYSELHELIGLDNVKTLVDDFLAAHQAQRFYDQKGMKTPVITKHMVFTGAPGTAKTTVARLLGKIMKDNDLLSVGGFFEVTRADLIERYVGWTAKNVKKIFALAKGSILFIDEAYSLMDGRDHSFGDEAIATIVSEMENARDDIMVIFAGYPKEMEEFVSRNPGLRSRINFTLDFKGYSLAELLEISKFMTHSKGFELSEEALSRISKLLSVEMSKPDYGNARYVRNLIDSAIIRHGSRLYKLGFDTISEEEIKTLEEDDFPQPNIDITSSREAHRTTKLS